MPIVFACLAPHGWLLVPLVAGADRAKAERSRKAMEELGRRLEAAAPETIVVVDVHGLRVEGTIALLDTPKLAGRTGGPRNRGATAHGYSLELTTDRELVAAIAAEARDADVPAARAANFLEFIPMVVEYGAMNPLYFLGAQLVPMPRVVVACFGPGVSREHCLAFGRAVGQAVEITGRRTAFVASADLAHAHEAGGPFGLHPDAAGADELVLEAARTGGLEGLMALPPETVEAARTEAVEPLLALAGALEGRDFQAEVLCYEVPTYFGMACVAFAPRA